MLSLLSPTKYTEVKKSIINIKKIQTNISNLRKFEDLKLKRFT